MVFRKSFLVLTTAIKNRLVQNGQLRRNNKKMAKLGSKEKPAVVKVQTKDQALKIISLCESKGWQVIVGIEPDENEDISDIEKLLNPPKPARSEKIDRNSPCPCGSGKKYKKCCLN